MQGFPDLTDVTGRPLRLVERASPVACHRERWFSRERRFSQERCGQ
jgi:hypothetical protein